ncbi:hypothetical protein [Vibrio taketomensis]|uniref:hypothetical protein n=1 Tax=Vibrio taketomensis TaxID=2572923 RepID=UPI00138A6C9C|nr:hypothetical protein [Vibrio taketomensis]
MEHEVGALILHNDILYVVVEDESHKSYTKAHPFQLFDGQIPGFNTVVSDVDESTIRALSELATHNQEMMRIDPHST